MKNPGDVADVLAHWIAQKLALTGAQQVIVWELVEAYCKQELDKAEVVPAGEEIVRILRLIEYEGPRELVERQIERSMHGTRVFAPKPDGREVRITAVTLDCFPEVLELARQTPEPGLLKDLRDTIQKLEAQLKLAREGV